MVKAIDILLGGLARRRNMGYDQQELGEIARKISVGDLLDERQHLVVELVLVEMRKDTDLDQVLRFLQMV